MELSGKRILVVGASGVLGAELTRQIAARGARVLGTARGPDSASRIPNEAALKLVADLQRPESVTTLTSYLAANESIDGVVLAAGVVGFGKATETPVEGLHQLMQTNFLGQAQLLSQLAPQLSGRPDAFVVAITGVVAERVFPSMSAYCASKTALSTWLSTATMEWRRDGIRVIEARPGHTETGLAGRAVFGTAPNFPQGLSAEHVVSKIIGAIESDGSALASTDF